MTAAGQPDPNTPSDADERNKNPHVEFLPYPAIIFINTRYGPQLARDDFLLHEAGHLLGLARRPEETADYHCLNKDCLMNATLHQHIGRQIFGQDPILQHQLCAQCVAELAKSSSQSPAGNLRFVGPVLVRSEAGYHVLSLPSRMELLVGSLTERHCRDFAAAVRTETPPPGMDGNAFHYELLMNKAENPDPAKLQEVINRAKADPYVMVRKAASRLEQLVNSE